MLKHTDIAVAHHGSLVLLQPLNDNAEGLRGHVSQEARWYVTALVVEPRYVGQIIRGAMVDGLLVQ